MSRFEHTVLAFLQSQHKPSTLVQTAQAADADVENIGPVLAGLKRQHKVSSHFADGKIWFSMKADRKKKAESGVQNTETIQTGSKECITEERHKPDDPAEPAAMNLHFEQGRKVKRNGAVIGIPDGFQTGENGQKDFVLRLPGKDAADGQPPAKQSLFSENPMCFIEDRRNIPDVYEEVSEVRFKEMLIYELAAEQVENNCTTEILDTRIPAMIYERNQGEYVLIFIAGDQLQQWILRVSENCENELEDWQWHDYFRRVDDDEREELYKAAQIWLNTLESDLPEQARRKLDDDCWFAKGADKETLVRWFSEAMSLDRQNELFKEYQFEYERLKDIEDRDPERPEDYQKLQDAADTGGQFYNQLLDEVLGAVRKARQWKDCALRLEMFERAQYFASRVSFDLIDKDENTVYACPTRSEDALQEIRSYIRLEETNQ